MHKFQEFCILTKLFLYFEIFSPENLQCLDLGKSLIHEKKCHIQIVCFSLHFCFVYFHEVQSLDEDMNLSMIGMAKVPGGSVTECKLIKGVAFKKTFSYAGFEQQPKRFENPKIALLKVELELKSESSNAEVTFRTRNSLSLREIYSKIFCGSQNLERQKV